MFYKIYVLLCNQTRFIVILLTRSWYSIFKTLSLSGKIKSTDKISVGCVAPGQLPYYADNHRNLNIYQHANMGIFLYSTKQ